MSRQMHQKVIQQTERMRNDGTTTCATIKDVTKVANVYFKALLYLFTTLTNLINFLHFNKKVSWQMIMITDEGFI